MFGVAWDLDGTLVDTELNHYAAWRDLMAEHGQRLTRERFRPTFGMRNDEILTGHFGFDPARHTIGDLSERKENLFRQSLARDGVRAQPGALTLLKHLHALGVPQAIASSAPPANIALIVDMLKLSPLLTAVVSGEEVAHGKPAPDIFLRTAERLGLAAGSMVVLEDAPPGVAAGKAAGSKVIALAIGFPADSLAAADLIVTSFEEVLWSREDWQRFLAS